jgi:hypothetical protein
MTESESLDWPKREDGSTPDPAKLFYAREGGGLSTGRVARDEWGHGFAVVEVVWV